MNLNELAENLQSVGIIKKKQVDTLRNKTRGKQSDRFEEMLEKAAASVEGWYGKLQSYGYSKRSGYSKGLVKAIKGGINGCIAYATENSRKSPTPDSDKKLLSSINKSEEYIPEKGDKLEMNVKASTIEAISKFSEAIDAVAAEKKSEREKETLAKAKATIAEIEKQINAAVDASSKTAAEKANAIFNAIESAVNDYVVGNISSPEAVANLGRALETAESWTTVKVSRWAKEANEKDVKTVKDINATVRNKANAGNAKNKILDALGTIKDKLEDIDSQKEKIDEMKEERRKLAEERDEYNDKIETVKADWMAKTISSVDAKELILEYQQNVTAVEDRIDMYNSRISQFNEVNIANKGKLKELQIIIENASFFADTADVIVSIASHIDFKAIHAYLSGSTNDIVIDKVCEIDAVANIIAKRMKVSAEEAKRKLRETRGFVSIGTKNVQTTEEKIKQSQKQKEDADDFMNSLMNGGSKTKVEADEPIISNPNSTIKISAGEEDI